MRKAFGVVLGALLSSSACDGNSGSRGDPASGGGGKAGSSASGGQTDLAFGGAGSPDTGGAAEAGGTEAGGTDAGGAETGGMSSSGGSSGGGRSASGGGGAGGTGAGSSAGSGGSSSGTPEVCTFQISDALSEQIPTVGLVDWSTDLPGLSQARIEFSLDDPSPGEINVGSGGPIATRASRALLLGLKPERSYTYRIVVSSEEQECVSPDRSLTTGAHDQQLELTQVLGEAAASRSNGFIVTCHMGRQVALILDADGAVVWQAAAPSGCSRAHMDWSGEAMWMLRANALSAPAGGTMGEVWRVGMDGSGVESLPGLLRSHHDFAVLPGGAAAFLVVEADGIETEVIERAADGTLTPLVRLDEATYGVASSNYHPNAIRYWALDDSLTVSDLNIVSITNFDRQGVKQWRVSGAELTGTHGHHLLGNGNLLSFKATTPSGVSEIAEYRPEDGALSLVWSYAKDYRTVSFGDVQRLGHGTTLITYSNAGVLVEVTAAGELVSRIETEGQVGYALWRPTLYGPPE